MLQRTFFAMAVIVLVARLVGLLFGRFRQPQVIGEIVGGIILGPTLVGALVGNSLFPLDIRPSLNLVGQLGLALYMFMVGLRLHARTVRTNPRMVSVISLASVALPFLLAMPLAAFLYTHHRTADGHHVDATAFYLFVGTSLSITAFPVLARILEERGMQNTELGAIATACAAVQDLIGWCLLAVILVIASAHGSAWTLVRIALESLACVVGIVILTRVLGWLEHPGSSSRLGAIVGTGTDAGSTLFPASLIGLLACAGATQAIGLHAVFGAFLFGILLRRTLPAAAREKLSARLGPVTTGLLLPVYFIIPGLSVNLRVLSGRGAIEIVLILIAACAGKIGGAYLSARSTGLSERQAGIMGALMNTRGLVELVVLQVALSAGILDQRLFSELVFMAVLTTLMTQPLLALMLRSGPGRASESSRGDLMALESR